MVHHLMDASEMVSIKKVTIDFQVALSSKVNLKMKDSIVVSVPSELVQHLVVSIDMDSTVTTMVSLSIQIGHHQRTTLKW